MIEHKIGRYRQFLDVVDNYYVNTWQGVAAAGTTSDGRGRNRRTRR